MCAKCNAAQGINTTTSFVASAVVACIYDIPTLSALLKVTSGMDKAWVQSAINVNSSKSCNKYNTYIDEIIANNP